MSDRVHGGCGKINGAKVKGKADKNLYFAVLGILSNVGRLNSYWGVGWLTSDLVDAIIETPKSMRKLGTPESDAIMILTVLHGLTDWRLRPVMSL